MTKIDEQKNITHAKEIARVFITIILSRGGANRQTKMAINIEAGEADADVH